MFTYFLMIVAALLYIALAYLLVRKFISTRNKGFIWLGASFLLWPFLQNALGIYEQYLANKMISGKSPSWLPTSGMTVGTFMQDFRIAQFPVLPALLLVALYYLGSRKIETREQLT